MFTDGDFNRPYIDRIVEVLVETQTRFDMAKEIIYDVEAGRQGIREASRTLQNFQGEGAVLQYTGRDNRPYGWADRKPKGRNRRAVINNYINQQIRKRNASKSSTNQSVIPSAKPTNPIREEVSDYINNRSDMQAIYKTIDKRYRIAGKTRLNEKSIESFANKILSQTHSKYSKELLTERLTALFEFMANSRDFSWDDIMQITAEISKDVLSQSSRLDTSMREEFSDTLKWLSPYMEYYVLESLCKLEEYSLAEQRMCERYRLQ